MYAAPFLGNGEKKAWPLTDIRGEDKVSWLCYCTCCNRLQLPPRLLCKSYLCKECPEGQASTCQLGVPCCLRCQQAGLCDWPTSAGYAQPHPSLKASRLETRERTAGGGGANSSLAPKKCLSPATALSKWHCIHEINAVSGTAMPTWC